MRPFVLVPATQFMPFGCALCKTQKGPLVDTLVDTYAGRVYICLRCSKDIARAQGLAEGERMEELTYAVDKLADKDAEIVSRKGYAAELESRLAEAVERGDRLEGELETAAARLVQANDQLRRIDEQIRATMESSRTSTLESADV